MLNCAADVNAKVGDWLLVKSPRTGGYVRRAEILAVRPGGKPPYTVRWIDDGQSLVFPGPDAEILTAEQLADRHRLETQRIARLQSAIGHATER